MRDSKQFNQYVELAEKVYHRASACTSCDDDYVDDSLYTELSVATLIYNHFCDQYVAMRETFDEHLSLTKLAERYDRDPEYAYAYMKQFEALLDKYHVENYYPVENYAR